MAAADQSESPDDVAVATSDVTSPTPNAPPSTPATVDDEEALDIIRTTPPDGIIDDNGGMITAEEMNMAELKVRVVCQEKANMALRMELKCAELQVTNVVCRLAFMHWTKTFICCYFLPRDAMHKRGLCPHAVSVCPSVTFVNSVKMSNCILRFLHRRVAKPFYFFVPNVMAIFRREFVMILFNVNKLKMVQY